MRYITTTLFFLFLYNALYSQSSSLQEYLIPFQTNDLTYSCTQSSTPIGAAISASEKERSKCSAHYVYRAWPDSVYKTMYQVTQIEATPKTTAYSFYLQGNEGLLTGYNQETEFNPSEYVMGVEELFTPVVYYKQPANAESVANWEYTEPTTGYKVNAESRFESVDLFGFSHSALKITRKWTQADKLVVTKTEWYVRFWGLVKISTSPTEAYLQVLPAISTEEAKAWNNMKTEDLFAQVQKINEQLGAIRNDSTRYYAINWKSIREQEARMMVLLDILEKKNGTGFLPAAKYTMFTQLYDDAFWASDLILKHPSDKSRIVEDIKYNTIQSVFLQRPTRDAYSYSDVKLYYSSLSKEWELEVDYMQSQFCRMFSDLSTPISLQSEVIAVGRDYEKHHGLNKVYDNDNVYANLFKAYNGAFDKPRASWYYVKTMENISRLPEQDINKEGLYISFLCKRSKDVTITDPNHAYRLANAFSSLKRDSLALDKAQLAANLGNTAADLGWLYAKLSSAQKRIPDLNRAVAILEPYRKSMNAEQLKLLASYYEQLGDKSGLKEIQKGLQAEEKKKKEEQRIERKRNYERIFAIATNPYNPLQLGNIPIALDIRKNETVHELRLNYEYNNTFKSRMGLLFSSNPGTYHVTGFDASYALKFLKLSSHSEPMSGTYAGVQVLCSRFNVLDTDVLTAQDVNGLGYTIQNSTPLIYRAELAYMAGAVYAPSSIPLYACIQFCVGGGYRYMDMQNGYDIHTYTYDDHRFNADDWGKFYLVLRSYIRVGFTF